MYGNEQHKSICSCDTWIALLVAFSAATTAAAFANPDVETITDGQIGKFDNLRLTRKTLSAITTV